MHLRKLPAPSHVFFFHFLNPSMELLRAAPRFQAHGHLPIHLDPLPETCISRTDRINGFTLTAHKIGVLNIVFPDSFHLRVLDDHSALITDNLHAPSPLEFVEIGLIGLPDRWSIIHVVVSFFGPDIQYHSYGEEVEVI